MGSLGYWLGQHPVGRGSQPWFYYLLLGGLYEFLPLSLAVGGAVALVRGLARPGWPLVPDRDLPHGVGAERLAAAPRPPHVSPNDPEVRSRSDVLALCLWWTVASWVAYAAAGEKMPWLMTHIVLPLLFGGWALADGETVDWRRVGTPRAVGSLGVPVAVGLVVRLVSHPPLSAGTRRDRDNVADAGPASLPPVVILGVRAVRAVAADELAPCRGRPGHRRRPATVRPHSDWPSTRPALVLAYAAGHRHQAGDGGDRRSASGRSVITISSRLRRREHLALCVVLGMPLCALLRGGPPQAVRADYVVGPKNADWFGGSSRASNATIGSFGGRCGLCDRCRRWSRDPTRAGRLRASRERRYPGVELARWPERRGFEMYVESNAERVGPGPQPTDGTAGAAVAPVPEPMGPGDRPRRCLRSMGLAPTAVSTP